MLTGHEEAYEAWRAGLSGGRMHHAWLLGGKRGLGKAHFAMEAAQELVDSAADVSFPADKHPDIHVLRPLPDGEEEARKAADGQPHKTKRNITVDQVRAMEHRLVTRPTVGRYRAIVIDSVDDMEKGAVNALLKSLEEPPQGTVFLLVSHRPGRLLPTVRSRCRMVRFSALPDEAVRRLLRDHDPSADEDTIAAALSVAGGSPGMALRFLDNNRGAMFAVMRRIAAEGDPHFALRSALSKAAGARPDRDTQLAAVELAAAVAAEVARSASGAISSRAVEAHVALSALLARAPTANIDPGTLILEAGGLLATIAHPREAAA